MALIFIEQILLEVEKNSDSGAMNGNMGNENLQCLSNEFLDNVKLTSQLAYTLNVAGFTSRTFYKNIP